MINCEIGCITTIYHYRFDSSHCFLGHTHKSAEINILLRGKMNFIIGNRLFRANAGEAYISPPWAFHHNRLVSESAEMVVLHFQGEEVERLVCGDWYARRLDDNELGLAAVMIGVLDSLLDISGPNTKPIYSERDEPERPEVGILKRLLEVLVSIIISSPSNIRTKSFKNAELCSEAVKIMTDRIGSRLTLDGLSGELHVCPAVLKAAFTDIMGKGAMQYFTEMKIGEARRMLELGKSISFVSDSLGFSSYSYFSTVFKRITGYSPREASRMNFNI